jgi:hypothetical protein
MYEQTTKNDPRIQAVIDRALWELAIVWDSKKRAQIQVLNELG